MNLADLGRIIGDQISEKKKQIAERGPVVGAVVGFEPRGDDLITVASESNRGTDEDRERSIVFQNSKRIIDDMAAADPKFADRVKARVAGIKSVSDFDREEQVKDAIISEARLLKRAELREKDPLFNAMRAGGQAFVDENLLGQLSRITGAGEAFTSEDGRSMEDIIREHAEYASLLQEEFPKSDAIGRIGAYISPKSPMKLLFDTAAKAGVKKTFGKQLTSEAIRKLPLSQKVGANVASTLPATAAVAGTKGLLGSGTETVFDFDRGGEQTLKGTIGSLIFSAGVPVAAKAGGSLIKGTVGGLNKALGSVAEQVTGTSEEALRAYGKFGKSMRYLGDPRAGFTEGQKLLEFVSSKYADHLPELQQADQLLRKLPNVDMRRPIATLQALARKADPSSTDEAAYMRRWTDHLIAKYGKGDIKNLADMPASRARQMIRELQEEADTAYNSYDPGLAGDAFMSAARGGRINLEGSAISKGGELGKTYVGLMRKIATHVDAVQKVKRMIPGRTPIDKRNNVEGFYNNLLGKNKTAQQLQLKHLDDTYGTDFLRKAELIKSAQEFGKEGAPKFLPVDKTGGFAKGGAYGGIAGAAGTGLVGAGIAATDENATPEDIARAGLFSAAFGGLAGGAGGASMASPRGASFLLGSADSINGVIRAIIDEPVILTVMRKNGAQNPAVKQMATELEKKLAQDGPASMGSLTRLFADTPYFLGFVHNFDKVKRQRAARRDERPNERSAKEIAAPPQY